MRIPFCMQSYQLDDLPVSAQRCVNMIAEAAPPDAKTQMYLYNAPGLLTFLDLTGSAIRGVEQLGDYLIFVADASVIRVASDGAYAVLGAVDGTDLCIMASSGTQTVIVTGTGSAFVATTTTLTQITDPDFPAVSSVAYLDGYFIFTRMDSGNFLISELLDAESYDALDYASAESSPDDLERVLVDHREVWLFGKRSVEVWVDTGAAAFPFVRQEGAVLERGCAAKASPAKADNSVFWLGDDKQVYRAEGYQPKIISTPAIARMIEGFEVVSDAQGWAYAQNGHTFYVLTFPTADRTIVYDASTGLWHERKSGVNEYGRWKISCGIEIFNKVIVGASDSGKLYYLSPTTYSDDGSTLQRVMMSSPLGDGVQELEMGTLEFVCDVGRGLATGQGSDPIGWFSWSNTAGRTWSNEYQLHFGAQGEYRKRVRRNRNGQFRSRVLKLTFSDPVPFGLYAVDGDVSKVLS